MNALRGAFILLLLSLNVVLWGTLLLLVAPAKFVLRGSLRRSLILTLTSIAEQWAAVNHALFDRLLPTLWDIEVPEGLDRNARYLVFANHVSWTDVLVIVQTFHRRTAFLRFFIKRQLLWLPIIGQASSALDFPFMRRYDAAYLVRHPEMRGVDLETTRRACERYRDLPVTLVNFLEATRFTRAKHAEQGSPYRHLLRPRTGGAAFVLASMADHLDAVLDVTISYGGHLITFWDFVSGRVPRIRVRVRRLQVPAEFCTAAITEPGPIRERFKAWLDTVWREKDAILDELI